MEEYESFSMFLAEHADLTAHNVIFRRQVSDEHIEEISRNHCRRWRSLPAHLNLGPILVQDIERSQGDEGERRAIFFRVWKERNGSEATYENLITALLKISCRQDAEAVLNMCANSQPQGTGPFPLLRMENLTANERERLIFELEEQSRAIHRSFGCLVSNVERYLETSSISTSNLQHFFEASGLEELAECIESTDTISEAMRKATRGRHWTFFNYELLESTVKTFCNTHITDLLCSYISEFKVYIANADYVKYQNIGMPHSEQTF